MVKPRDPPFFMKTLNVLSKLPLVGHFGSRAVTHLRRFREVWAELQRRDAWSAETARLIAIAEAMDRSNPVLWVSAGKGIIKVPLKQIDWAPDGSVGYFLNQPYTDLGAFGPIFEGGRFPSDGR